MASKPMTKTQLISALADETGSDKKTAGVALDGMISIISREVSGGGAVTLPVLERFTVESAQREQ